MEYWPHQDRAHAESRRHYATGSKRWCLVAPCGAGKTTMMQRMALPAAEKGLNVFIYTHRVLLTRQMLNVFRKAGATCGVIAASDKANEDRSAKIQICSVQTMASRIGTMRDDYPNPDIVIVDEAHAQTGDSAKKVFAQHVSNGAKLIGFTATPVGIGESYDHLVEAGKYSEMLACKAHLPMKCYGPDRPDLSQLKPMAGGDFSSEDDRRINSVPTIFGNVFHHWKKLNPDALPTIGFAPGVKESQWFVESFLREGVACAHIDSERVVMVDRNSNGVLESKEYPTDQASREAVIEGSKEGRYKIVWNRFVLREAIDMPWLFHGILATSMGALSTYLQSVGRPQRYWPSYDHVVLQDHGGNLDRHGMPDVDREWDLDCTNNSMHKKEVEERAKKKGDEAEPICCPKCCAYRLHGPQCQACGYMHSRSVRMVRQLDGELTRQVGRVVKYQRPKAFDDYLRSSLFAAGTIGQTVKQAYYVAEKRAKEAGVEIKSQAIKLPANGSDDWARSVREIYPWARKKVAK